MTSGTIDSHLSLFSKAGIGLRPHQEDGIRWMFELEHKGTGGLLADDPGLGKTFQALALASTASATGSAAAPATAASSGVAWAAAAASSGEEKKPLRKMASVCACSSPIKPFIASDTSSMLL